MAKRRTWRWVTRDPGEGEAQWVCIWKLASVPRLRKINWWDGWEWTQTHKAGGLSDLWDCCYEEFKRELNITIPTDRPVKVEFTARVLDD